MLQALEYDFFVRALLAGALASVACGIMGTYVVVKRMASISGGLSHAAFGGIGLGYLLGFSPTLGATLFAVTCGLGVGVAYKRLRSGPDTLIAVIWAVGMALGILFISLSPGYAPDMMSYLFGSILFVPGSYVVFVLALDVVIVLVVGAMFHQLQGVTFDEEFCQVVGVRTEVAFLILMGLVSLAIVTLIRVVGVILVIALLTIPAAIARQWTIRLVRMMVLASLVGAACTTFGLFGSYWLSERFSIQIPTGPLIILLAIGLYLASSLVHAALRSRERAVVRGS